MERNKIFAFMLRAVLQNRFSRKKNLKFSDFCHIKSKDENAMLPLNYCYCSFSTKTFKESLARTSLAASIKGKIFTKRQRRPIFHPASLISWGEALKVFESLLNSYRLIGQLNEVKLRFFHIKFFLKTRTIYK